MHKSETLNEMQFQEHINRFTFLVRQTLMKFMHLEIKFRLIINDGLDLVK